MISFLFFSVNLIVSFRSYIIKKTPFYSCFYLTKQLGVSPRIFLFVINLQLHSIYIYNLNTDYSKEFCCYCYVIQISDIEYGFVNNLFNLKVACRLINVRRRYIFEIPFKLIRKTVSIQNFFRIFPWPMSFWARIRSAGIYGKMKAANKFRGYKISFPKRFC